MNSQIKNNKHKLRTHFNTLRKQLTESYRTQASVQIQDHLLAFIQQSQAQKIALYHELPHEVIISPLTLKLDRKNSYKLYLPYNNCNKWSIQRYSKQKLNNQRLSKINKAMYNKSKLFINLFFTYKDIILIPGVAFDMHGNRLGRGASIYDRWLEDCEAIKIGIAFAKHISDMPLPHEKHDVKMDYVVTEDAIIEILN